MAEPITWRNVLGASPAEAARPLAYAGQSINLGFENLKEVLGSVEKTDRANWDATKNLNQQALMNKLMSYKTPEELAAGQEELAGMTADMGAQYDPQALRTALDTRPEVLQNRQLGQIKYDDTLQAKAHEPLAQAFRTAMLSKDKAAMAQLAQNFPGMPQLPALMAEARAFDQQEIEKERATTQFLQNQEMFPLQKQKLQGEITNGATRAQTDQIQATTAQLQAQAAIAAKAAAERTATADKLESRFKATIKSTEEDFEKNNKWGGGSTTQMRNGESVGKIVGEMFKDPNEAAMIIKELTNPTKHTVKDKDGNVVKDAKGNPVTMEGYPVSLVREALQQNLEGRMLSLDGTRFSSRPADIKKYIDKRMTEDPSIAQDYQAYKQLEANKLSGWASLKASIMGSAGADTTAATGTGQVIPPAPTNAAAVAAFNDPKNRDSIMGHMAKIAANRPPPIPWTPGQVYEANQKSAVQNEALKNLQINRLVQDWLDTKDPALKADYARQIKAAGGEVPGK